MARARARRSNDGGSGDGPDYTGLVRVAGYDAHDLDRDGDGIACDA